MRPLAPAGGNDRVYTPPDVARLIVDHFRPCGKVLEPCKGKGAFTDISPNCFWCEIDDGIDFMEWQDKVDWIVTNPPWSKFRDFLNHSMKVADNVVFLCLVNAWFMKARQKDIKNSGFGLVEILEIDAPKRPWPQTGFCLGAGWIKRGWSGGISFVGGAYKEGSSAEQAESELALLMNKERQ